MRRFHLLMSTAIIGMTCTFGGVAGAQSSEPAEAQLLIAQVMPSPGVMPAERKKPKRDAAKPARAPRTTTAATLPGCLSPDRMPDTDGDFARNMDELSRTPGLCFTYDRFEEHGIHWTLQIIQYQRPGNEISLKTRERPGPLWFIPHDDENAAFDTAVKSLIKYGGTIVAVESGGTRLNEGQDPNRNFDAGGDRKCPQQLARSEIYTDRVLQWRDPEHPIIALHSNRPTGNITITRKVPFSTNFRATRSSVGGIDPDHTLVFVASPNTPEADPALRELVDGLNSNGVNVIYETVASKHSDCSLSNYASLTGIRNYLNVEVITGDSPTQIKIVDVIMKLKGQGLIGSQNGSARTTAETGPTGSVEPISKPSSANADNANAKSAKKPKKTANRQKKPTVDASPQ